MDNKKQNLDKPQKAQLNIPAVSGSYKGLPKPKLEDFYDTSDPRGCSSSEYEYYLNAVKKWELENNYA